MTYLAIELEIANMITVITSVNYILILLFFLINLGTSLDSQDELKDAVHKLCTHSNDAVKTKAESLYSNI